MSELTISTCIIPLEEYMQLVPYQSVEELIADQGIATLEYVHVFVDDEETGYFNRYCQPIVDSPADAKATVMRKVMEDYIKSLTC